MEENEVNSPELFEEETQEKLRRNTATFGNLIRPATNFGITVDDSVNNPEDDASPKLKQISKVKLFQREIKS